MSVDVADPLWEADLRRLDRELAEDLGNLAALTAPFPLSIFGQLLLAPEQWVPRASAFLPTMPTDDVQTLWTGSCGAALLHQSVEFIRTAALAIARQAIPLEAARVLDFGVGWGRLARLWLKYSAPERLYGCDNWQRSLDEARACGLRNELRLSADLMEELPFPVNHFDAAYAFSVFTHLSPTAFAACLEGISRMLRPGGVLVFTVRPKAFWTVPAIAAELAARGVRDIDSRFEDGSLFVPHGKRIHYGDASFSREFLEARCQQAGLTITGFDWSLLDEYQVVVTAVRA